MDSSANVIVPTPLVSPVLHTLIILAVMISAGIFGGFINYYYSFEEDRVAMAESSVQRVGEKKLGRCLLLSVGAALLVPNFLNMISSTLLESTNNNPINYLILIGFCLIFAIFSRRFITTISDKILASAQEARAAAKESIVTAKESNIKASQAKQEARSNAEEIGNISLRISNPTVNEQTSSDVHVFSNEDVRKPANETAYKKLGDMIKRYISDTSIPEYDARVIKKQELSKYMGLFIIKNNLDKSKVLLENNNEEGAIVAVCATMRISPSHSDFSLLKKIWSLANQLYTKSVIVGAIYTLAQNSFLSHADLSDSLSIMEKIYVNDDAPLKINIDRAINLIKVKLSLDYELA